MSDVSRIVDDRPFQDKSSEERFRELADRCLAELSPGVLDIASVLLLTALEEVQPQHEARLRKQITLVTNSGGAR